MAIVYYNCANEGFRFSVLMGNTYKRAAFMDSTALSGIELVLGT